MNRAMLIILIAIAALIGGLFVSASQARQTNAQKQFRQLLLNDSSVDPAVKLLLQNGGFVEPDILFDDFTGEGKIDAIVSVNSSAISGTVAVYALTAGSGKTLKVVFRDESGYMVSARMEANQKSGSTLITDDPVFSPGDRACCSARVFRRTWSWDAKKNQFKLLSSKRVRVRYTAQTS